LKILNTVREWLIRRHFKPVGSFISYSGLCSIDFPEGWIYREKKNRYDFVSPDQVNGALQLTVIYNPDPTYSGYNQKEMLEKVRQNDGISAISAKLGAYEAVFYKQTIKEAHLIDHRWYSGFKNTRVFITFQQDSEQPIERIHSELAIIDEILKGIRIGQP